MENLKAPLGYEICGEEQQVRGLCIMSMYHQGIRMGEGVTLTHNGKDVLAFITGIFLDGFAFVPVREVSVSEKGDPCPIPKPSLH